MDFRLYYRGPLHANGSPVEKHRIRREVHRQLATLWNQPPLVDQKAKWLSPEHRLWGGPIQMVVGPFTFVPMVTSRLNAVADLDVLFLRPQRAGAIVSSGGDLDNRLKTLLDALTVPKVDQLPKGATPSNGEDLFYCLLEDDVLVTRLAVTSDQLLEFTTDDEVVLVIRVKAGSPPDSLGTVHFY